MSIASLQRGLQEIYELDIRHDVGDFLITCRDVAESLGGGPAFANAREKLLVRQQSDELKLSLYLHPDVVATLDRIVSPRGLEMRDLQDFCLGLEGVSHFLYLIWNATYSRSVTLLEMELQAEIDKFVVISRCLDIQPASAACGGLIDLLFHAVAFREDLGPAEQRRYREANDYARRYCCSLVASYQGPGGRPGLLNELRRFYRMSGGKKLERIRRLH
jgi:hypothetical protein